MVRTAVRVSGPLRGAKLSGRPTASTVTAITKPTAAMTAPASGLTTTATTKAASTTTPTRTATKQRAGANADALKHVVTVRPNTAVSIRATPADVHGFSRIANTAAEGPLSLLSTRPRVPDTSSETLAF